MTDECPTFAKKHSKNSKEAVQEVLITERIDIKAEAVEFFIDPNLFEMVMS